MLEKVSFGIKGRHKQKLDLGHNKEESIHLKNMKITEKLELICLNLFSMRQSFTIL